MQHWVAPLNKQWNLVNLIYEDFFLSSQLQTPINSAYSYPLLETGLPQVATGILLEVKEQRDKYSYRRPIWNIISTIYNFTLFIWNLIKTSFKLILKEICAIQQNNFQYSTWELRMEFCKRWNWKVPYFKYT